MRNLTHALALETSFHLHNIVEGGGSPSDVRGFFRHVGCQNDDCPHMAIIRFAAKNGASVEMIGAAIDALDLQQCHESKDAKKEFGGFSLGSHDRGGSYYARKGVSAAQTAAAPAFCLCRGCHNKYDSRKCD